MVHVRVARYDDVDEREQRRVDDEPRDALVGASVSPYLAVIESERYGSRRMFSPVIWTRNPLWPSHQMCIPVSSFEAWISAIRSSPESMGSIQSGVSSSK